MNKKGVSEIQMNELAKNRENKNIRDMYRGITSER
jgi:hypothetical protein